MVGTKPQVLQEMPLTNHKNECEEFSLGRASQACCVVREQWAGHENGHGGFTEELGLEESKVGQQDYWEIGNAVQVTHLGGPNWR